MRWRGPALKALLSRAPVTTGDEALGVQIGTGEAVAIILTLAECLHGSLWTPARGAETCDTSLMYTIMRLGEL